MHMNNFGGGGKGMSQSSLIGDWENSCLVGMDVM
jgi:hypothetical protein